MTPETPMPPPMPAPGLQPSSRPPSERPDGPSPAPRRATVRFMLAHPAHWIALGFGSGLAPRAAGTVGTLWAWISFLVLDLWLDDVGWAFVIGFAAGIGLWACTRTAQNMRSPDPGAIVWDEVLGFWIVLWLLTPAPAWQQLLAFALFRLFDAVKRGPVGWADRRFKLRPGQAIGWRQGFGILFDDLVAALLTLLVMALILSVVARWAV